MAPYHEVLVVSCVYLCVYVRAHLWLKVPVYSLSIDYLICTGVFFFFMKNSVTIPNPFCHNGGRGRRWKEPNNCFYLTVHTFCKHVARLCNITVNLEILRQLWLPGVSLVVALSEHWILHDNSRCTAFQKKKDHDKIPVQVFPKVWPPLKRKHMFHLQRVDLRPLQCFYSLSQTSPLGMTATKEAEKATRSVFSVHTN